MRKGFLALMLLILLCACAEKSQVVYYIDPDREEFVVHRTSEGVRGTLEFTLELIKPEEL